MPDDFVPSNDDLFEEFANAFLAWVQSNGTSRGLTTSQINALANLANPWNYAFVGFQAARTTYHSFTEDKDDKRAPYENLIRQFAGILQKNPAMTDADRVAAHLTVPKTSHTPATTPDTVPMLQKADTSTRGILRLFIADSMTPESRAKPDNARSVQIWEQIGGTMPTNPATMQYLGDETRTPYRADFEPEDIGKTVYLAFRWIGKNNEPGPWSMIYSLVIPG